MEHIDYKKVLSSDFCESIFDGTHDSPKYVESGYPLVTSKYIFGSKIDYLSAPQISKTDYDLINKRSKVKLFDVLVSMIGINAGIVALVDNEPQYAIKNVGAFRCKNEINAKYLYYYLQSFKGQYMLKNSMTGSAQPYISLERLRTLQFLIPEERIQRHIVNTIGTIDNLIENKQKIINKLKEYSTLLYKDYLAIESINKINLGDCCVIKTGKLNADQAVVNGKYLFFTCGKEDLYINDYAFDCKAIIISGNGEISVKYYDGKFNAYQRTYVLEPHEYFYIFLKECELSIEDLKMNSQGSVIRFITKGMLEKISIPINDSSNILNEKIKDIYNNISIIIKEINLLSKIKQDLLSKYF